jgi:hypothetical protein
LSDLFEPTDEPDQGNGGSGRHRGPGMMDRLREANQAARKERDRRRAVRLMQKLGPDAPQGIAGPPGDGSETRRDGGLTAEQADADRWEDAAVPAPFRFSSLVRPGILLGALFILALVLYPLGMLPGIAPSADKFLSLNVILQYSIIIIGLNLIAGFTGQLSLGQSIFTAVGGYASAVISSKVIEGHGGPWIGLVAAIVISVVIGVVLGLPSLRVRGAYLAIVTLAFVPIFARIFTSGPQSWFGGSAGLRDLRTPVPDRRWGSPSRPRCIPRGAGTP